MAGIANWKRDGKVIPFGEEAVSGVEADLRQVERACREIAFCELAEAMAKSRIAALRGAVSGCRAEVAAQPESRELHLAAVTLEAELASFEETLPIECAYRADQRDMALARLGRAQDRLREGACCEDEIVRVRVQAALALSPGMLARHDVPRFV